jgi:hypothetical protein
MITRRRCISGWFSSNKQGAILVRYSTVQYLVRSLSTVRSRRFEAATACLKKRRESGHRAQVEACKADDALHDELHDQLRERRCWVVGVGSYQGHQGHQGQC